MKLTDYVIDFLVRQGIGHVFGFSGGGVVHLLDSAYRNKHIDTIFCHHEQAVALAAVAYAKVTNNLGAAIVTTGPGGSNAITGVLAAWQDSIPTIFISGQSRLDHVSRGKYLRQLGTQEFDILSIVKPITKYAEMPEDPNSINYHLEKAVYYAREGRPGPVWIDLPLNFHWAQIDENNLSTFKPEDEICEQTNPQHDHIKRLCDELYRLIFKAERPLILSGYGIRLAHAEEEFRKLIDILNIPFISTWTASDIIPNNHHRNTGRPGIAGQRGANLAIQNCDLLILLRHIIDYDQINNLIRYNAI